jgi:FtsP/CotA-like multicopper oxidase with cupredoxin domain
MDGAPPLTQKAIAPGASFDCRFVAPDAGTFWYHAPRPNPFFALYGALIVEETEPPEVDQEVTLIYGGPYEPHLSLNSLLKVNGVDNYSVITAANQRMRLRLINATFGQILRLRMAELRPFVIAIDGQPAQPFTARGGELTLGPGNRIDVIVDCTLAPGSTALMTMEDSNPRHSPVVTLQCDPSTPGRATPRDALKSLPPNPLPETMDFRGAFRLDVATGQRVQRNPLFTVRRGRTVVMGISKQGSDDDYLHPYGDIIHLHGHSFRLLDALDDGWKPFWLDTMPLAPGDKARIAFVADNPGKWLIEGLVTQSGAGVWFEVT